MEPPMSSYWVRFFKNAGFPNDVATRHALIFSNNRIKPDMLPDLDKPSLKEMGITLMGDMIAILRYAKKVVEETTTKKFLVNTEDSPTPVKTITKPVVKKTIVTKTLAKTPSATKVKLEAPTKVLKMASSSVAKPAVVKKKLPPVIQTSRMYSDYIDTTKAPKTSPLKRKYDSEDEEDSDEKWGHNESEKRLKPSTNNVEYKVILPKTTVRTQKLVKKAVEQKRTVFHRLGDSMVSSTTTIIESANSNFNPTFTVTGIGQDVHKRTSSVFNRLGNKDSECSDTLYNRNLRNGGVTTQGILKTRTPMLGTKVITTKATLKKVGTMRADEEANKKAVSESVRQLVRTTKNLKFSNSLARSESFPRKLPMTGKLASEKLAVPVKSRLGGNKQVTFNKTPTVTHVKRTHQVFSRLGV